MQDLPGHIWLQPYHYHYHHHHLQDDHHYTLSIEPAGPAQVCTDNNLQPDLAPPAATDMHAIAAQHPGWVQNAAGTDDVTFCCRRQTCMLMCPLHPQG